MTPEQAFVYARPSFEAADTIPNGQHWGVELKDGSIWSVHLSLNVGLE